MYIHQIAQQHIRCMRVLVLAVALFFLLPVKWSFCSPNDISVHFKEFVVRDGRWGAKFSLKNNTRDHVVTHIDYRGEYRKDGKKKTFTRKREGKLKLNKPLLPGKSFTLTVLLSAPATSHIENITLAVTDYRYRNKAQKKYLSGRSSRQTTRCNSAGLSGKPICLGWYKPCRLRLQRLGAVCLQETWHYHPPHQRRTGQKWNICCQRTCSPRRSGIFRPKIFRSGGSCRHIYR